MRILGIDHGTVRIGLALSDELGWTAQPLPFIETAQAARIAEIVEERAVTKIVVGRPRNMDGSYGRADDAVKEFVANLRSLVSIPIELWDERLTTSQANRVLIEGNVSRAERKKKVDSMAAQLMLQSYLDAHAG
jgi:putative Holliday junction resolvase